MNFMLNKLNFLLSKKQRGSLIYITILLFFGMVLEIFGLGVIVPMLTFILEPDSLGQFLKNSTFIKNIGITNQSNFLYFFLIGIVLLYVIKTIVIIYLVYKQNRFITDLYSDFSVNLFNNYINQNYSFHLNKNSSILVKNIQVEVNLFRSFLSSWITIVIETSLLLAIMLTLIFIEPIGALSIGLFFSILSIVMFSISKKKLKSWGKKREVIDSSISKHILETFGGIKDILILGRKNYFEKYFFKVSRERSRILKNYLTISQTPRYFFELVAIFGLVGFIFIMILIGKDNTELISILGVFVAATFRMIPSFNRIFSAFQNAKYYTSSVDLMYKEFKSFYRNQTENNYIKSKDFNSKIEIRNLTFSYSKSKDLVLKKINLTINKGDSIGIIGESGSGKSTLVDLLMGLYKPKDGKIMIDGVDIHNNTRNWQNKIGYVPQSIFLTDDSILKNIALGIDENLIDFELINSVVKASQLEKFIHSLDEGINTQVGERGVQLSGGQLQRIGIARALYNQPEILILDEATASLDYNTEINVMEAIKNIKKDKTLIIVAHRLTTIDDCDYIYKIEKGEINIKNEKYAKQ